MKIKRKFFLGLLGVIFLGWMGTFLPSGILQLLYLVFIAVVIVFLLVFFWTRDRALAVGLLAGALFPVWGVILFLVGVCGLNWLGDMPHRNIISKLEKYKLENKHYPDSLEKIGVAEQIRGGYTYRYQVKGVGFELCAVYDEAHTFGGGEAKECWYQ